MARSKPPDDASRFVSQGYITEQKPAIHSVNAPYAGLILKGNSGSQALPPFPQSSLDILRMEGGAPAPALHLCQFEAGEFEPALIDEIERAVSHGTYD